MAVSRSSSAGWRLRALLVAAAVGLALLPTPSAWVERVYSTRLYLLSQNVLTPLSGLFGFALLDLLLVAALVGVPWWWVATLRSARPGHTARTGGRLLVDTLTLVAVCYLVFLAAWGLNYRRQPLASKLVHDPTRVTAGALAALAEEATERLNTLHGPAHARAWGELDELPARLGPAFTAAQVRLEASRFAVPGPPKWTVLTWYFQLAGIDGMVNPFALEVLVNRAVLPFERPFLVAHEWAHLAGYADESEASFVGWLTCLQGGPDAQYSAWLALLPRVMRHLGTEQQTALWDRLDPGPLADLRAVSARLTSVAPVVQRNANRVYDRYLRANRVDEGIASYGLVVDLVLGTPLGRQARGALEGGGV